MKLWYSVLLHGACPPPPTFLPGNQFFELPDGMSGHAARVIRPHPYQCGQGPGPGPCSAEVSQDKRRILPWGLCEWSSTVFLIENNNLKSKLEALEDKSYTHGFVIAAGLISLTLDSETAEGEEYAIRSRDSPLAALAPLSRPEPLSEWLILAPSFHFPVNGGARWWPLHPLTHSATPPRNLPHACLREYLTFAPSRS
jgi:hypothetical protein